MGKWYPKRPDLSTAEMQAMRAAGASFATIGAHMGISAAGVHCRLRRAVEPAKQKATWQEITRRRMLSAAKKRAQQDGVPFSLQLADIFVPDCCPILGMEFVLGAGHITDASPTLDRVIPALGYVPANVWVISWRANRAKSDLTVEELMRLANALSAKIKEALWR